jgi:hypothetical protein
MLPRVLVISRTQFDSVSTFLVWHVVDKCSMTNTATSYYQNDPLLYKSNKSRRQQPTERTGKRPIDMHGWDESG